MTARPLRRDLAEAVLREVIAACDPARRVSDALAEPALAARLAGRRVIGLAVGKAALAMARGAGPVAEGLAVVPEGSDGAALPAGWRRQTASHPVPDARSLAAGAALRALIERARPDDAVVALISGGASALVELPAADAAGAPAATPAALDAMVATVRQVMAAGAPIA